MDELAAKFKENRDEAERLLAEARRLREHSARLRMRAANLRTELERASQAPLSNQPMSVVQPPGDESEKK